MSSPAVAVFRGNNYYFHTQFQPPVPWTPIQLKGQYEIQSIFYEITTSAIQVRILTPEDKEALVLFPIHFGSKEYAYLFLSFKNTYSNTPPSSKTRPSTTWFILWTSLSPPTPLKKKSDSNTFIA